MAGHLQTRPLNRDVCRTPDMLASLTYYPPNVRQDRHSHSQAQLSYLLAGGLREISDTQDGPTHGTSCRFLAPDGHHEVHFGDCGALILSIDFAPGQGPQISRDKWQKSGTLVAEHLALLGLGGGETGDALEALVALTDLPDAENTQRPTPRFLHLAAEKLADQPTSTIAEVARTVGVSRHYLSRSFSQHFGMSPVQYRAFRRLSIANRAMLHQSASVADAAHAAGFADQSHMTRTFRALAGMSPARLQRALRR